MSSLYKEISPDQSKNNDNHDDVLTESQEDLLTKYYLQYKKRKSQDATNISSHNRNLKNNLHIIDSLEGRGE
jgi:hypothetical protein